MAIKYRARNQITEATNAMRDLMQSYLNETATKMIEKVMKNVRNLPDASKLNAIKNIPWYGVTEYKAALLEAMTLVSSEALAQARKEVPAAKKVKLGEWENLPASIRKRLTAKNTLLINTQMSDLEKAIFFQFQSSVDSTDSLDTLEQDLIEASDSYVFGQAIVGGSGVISAEIVNEARSAFFYADDVLEEIDAFVFVNENPVTDICIDLNGTVFAKDDPGRDRYQPPLHFNCKSSIQAILKGNLDHALKKYGQEEIQKLKPSKSAYEDTIQFAHKCSHTNLGMKQEHLVSIEIPKANGLSREQAIKLAEEHICDDKDLEFTWTDAAFQFKLQDDSPKTVTQTITTPEGVRLTFAK